MATLLAGLPVETAATTINRLCGSGLDAVNYAARAIAMGEGEIYIAGGTESMTRAPLVTAKPNAEFPRGNMELFDTTIGWRFINPKLQEMYGTDSMPETAENVAKRFSITRERAGSICLSKSNEGKKKQWSSDCLARKLSLFR